MGRRTHILRYAAGLAVATLILLVVVLRLLASESATVEFEWLDTNGQIYGQSRYIAVG